jgi:hypothetical protein
VLEVKVPADGAANPYAGGNFGVGAWDDVFVPEVSDPFEEGLLKPFRLGVVVRFRQGVEETAAVSFARDS